MKSIIKTLSVLACITFFFSYCKKHHDVIVVNPDLRLLADNLVSPVTLAQPPGDTSRLFVVDQIGKIWIYKQNGTKLPDPFIDISSKIVTLKPQYDERGLLGLAFHPNFQSNGRFYLFYTAPPRPGGPQPGVSWSSLTTISEFKVSSSNPNIADMTSEKIIFQADHPQSNHNGGTVAFGPDGFLYFAIGDGGNKDDVGPGHLSDWYATNAGGNAQNVYANLLGKVSRIDINSGNPYTIPTDNPYASSSTAMKEIYAFGFRNPYRFSFDIGGAHQLLLGDAGQSLYEEIDLVTKGGNYGWNVKEGAHCFNTDSDLLVRASCPSVDSAGKPLIDPVIELRNHANPAGGGIATVIVGGNVYRGKELSDFNGRYVFGIFSQDGNPNAKIYVTNANSWDYSVVNLRSFPNDLGQYVKGFGQDNSGEVYVMTTLQQGPSGTSGKVYKIVGTH